MVALSLSGCALHVRPLCRSHGYGDGGCRQLADHRGPHFLRGDGSHTESGQVKPLITFQLLQLLQQIFCYNEP